MKLYDKQYWQSKLVYLAVRWDWLTLLLSLLWRKRLLVKIATGRQKRGQVALPNLLLSSLKKKHLVDVKKQNHFSFCNKILAGQNQAIPSVPIQNINSNKISILLVVHNCLPYDAAGYALRTLHEAKALKKLGYEVSIVTRMGYPWDIAKHRHLPHSNCNIVEGIEILSITGSRQYKVDSDQKYAIEYGQRVADIVKQRGINLIQASSNYINGYAGYFAARKCQIPFIYEARGMWHITREGRDLKFGKSEQYSYEDKMERWVLDHASANVFITKIMSNKYHGNNLLPSIILRNGIEQKNTIVNALYNSNKPFKLVYAGSLVYYEGIEYLIKAVSELLDKQVTLDIYGDGPYRVDIEKVLTKVNTKNITYHGKVDSSLVSDVYSKSCCGHSSY